MTADSIQKTLLPCVMLFASDRTTRTQENLPVDLRKTFRALHEKHFTLPNPSDLGSARILASMGFPALATTSAGFANALGRADGAVTRDKAIFKDS
jgi:2-methylisocitrate lyase-like PEP mutase family enzyme